MPAIDPDALIAQVGAEEPEAAPEPAQTARRAGDKGNGTASERKRDLTKRMLGEVDLLNLIRSDDPGKETVYDNAKDGRIIAFGGRCPVCGHNDDLRYYERTNTWLCSTGEGRYEGGTYLEYMKATRNLNDAEAMKALYTATGTEWEPDNPPMPEAAPSRRASAFCDDLPPIVPVQMLNPPPRAPVLIEGVLRKGHKLMLTGASKMGKSWCIMQLAVAVATGSKWLKFQCEQGRVLYLNMEIDPASCMNRFHKVGEALGLDMAEAQTQIDVWNLRGTEANMRTATAALLHRREQLSEYALVILDPLYKLQDGDENSAQDIRSFFAQVDVIGRELGSAVAIVHHHSKGGKGDMAAGDRGSGSGVLLRDPDASIDLIEVEPADEEERDALLKPGEFVCRVQAGGIREFPRFETFDAVFRYPLHILDEAGTFSEWKPATSANKGGKESGKVRVAQAQANLYHTEAVALELIAKGGDWQGGVTLAEVAEALKAEGGAKTTTTVKDHLTASKRIRVESYGKGKAPARAFARFEPAPLTLL